MAASTEAMVTRAASRNERIPGNSASARPPVLREIDAAASHMAIGEVIGSGAASSAWAKTCASASSVRMATIADASTNTIVLGLVQAVAERLAYRTRIFDPRPQPLAQRCDPIP